MRARLINLFYFRWRLPCSPRLGPCAHLCVEYRACFQISEDLNHCFLVGGPQHGVAPHGNHSPSHLCSHHPAVMKNRLNSQYSAGFIWRPFWIRPCGACQLR